MQHNKMVAEQATGCVGAGSYKDFAEAHGFKHVEVLDWTSGAGDWQFIVSKDGSLWQILSQTNNYPRAGFTHELSEEYFEGTANEVLTEIYELYC